MATSITLRSTKGSALTYTEVDDNFSNLKTTADAAAVAGAIGSSGLTMATSRLLGRSSASTGAVQEIIVGAGLALSGGQLEANLGAYLTSADAATTYQPKDDDLTAIAAISGTSGLLKKTAANTWSLDTSSYLTGTDAAGLYQPLTGMSSYLTTTAAASTYQTQSAMSSYLTTTTASTTYAPRASPSLTGTPVAPTAAVDTNTTQIATTAYVMGQGYLKSTTASTTYAPLSSPSLTGTPSAPTAAADTNTTQIATTAYVIGQGYLKSTAASTTYAPLASPSLTGTPVAPTAAADTNTTQIATTAYVVGQGYLKSTTASSTYLALSGGQLSGNLGIGVSAAAKLDVSGGIAQNVVAVSASAIDCSAGNFFTKTATGALTWTFTNVPASRAFAVIIELTNGGTGTQSWPASVKWPSGTAPTLTTSGVDLLAFVTDDGGTTWRGVQLMKDSR